jgi:hypothetical protein
MHKPPLVVSLPNKTGKHAFVWERQESPPPFEPENRIGVLDIDPRPGIS